MRICLSKSQTQRISQPILDEAVTSMSFNTKLSSQNSSPPMNFKKSWIEILMAKWSSETYLKIDTLN